MEIVALNDELSEYDLAFDHNLYKKIVYYYTSEAYEGYGELIALSNENMLYVYNLSHCSCYGPMENGGPDETLTVQEYLAKYETSTIGESQAIVAYIKEHIESF